MITTFISTSIPHTSLRPSVLCLGTADMGTKIPRDEAFRILDAYVAAGGNFIDTAAVYSDWVPGEPRRVERLLGDWLTARNSRDQIILATKGAHPLLETMHVGRMRRADIEADLNESLRSLRTDVIDLYWLHRDDTSQPVEAIIDVLNAQVRAGKIRFFGCSNWRPERIRAANAYAQSRGAQGFVANQPMWSLAYVPQEKLGDQTCTVMDDAAFQFHVESGMACVPFSSQANGFFQRMAAGTVGQMNDAHQDMYGGQRNVRRFAQAQRIAQENGFTLTQVVLAYLLSQPFPVFPIIGCRSVEQLSDTLTAHDKRLTPEQVKALAEKG